MNNQIKISVEQLLQEIGALTMENKELRRALQQQQSEKGNDKKHEKKEFPQ